MTINFSFSKIATDDAGWAQECERSRGKGKGTAGGITSGSGQKSGKATQIQTTGIEGPKGSTSFAAQTKPSKDTPAPAKPSSSSSSKLTSSAKAGLIGEVDHPSQKRILDLDDETDDEDKSAAPKKNTQSIKKKKKSKTATPVSAPASNPVSLQDPPPVRWLPRNSRTSPPCPSRSCKVLTRSRSRGAPIRPSSSSSVCPRRVPDPPRLGPDSIETQQKDEAAAIIIGLSDSKVRWPHSARFPLELAP